MDKIRFRLAHADDAEKLLDVYAPYVENTNISFEYEVPTEEEFRQRIEKISAKFPYIVALVNGEIVGYAYASTFRTKAAYDRSLETTIYIKKNFHRHGIGRKLYKILEDLLKLQNITNLYVSITYPNLKSMKFHEKLGYVKIAHFNRCGYKRGAWLDMIFLEKIINKHVLPAKEIIYMANLPQEKIDNVFSKYNEA
ncbi:GNAT family N-acetyltransferase [Megamonas hypermegale]|uniref:GNAT family N-acetyltransferase n=1 Tax=Megamonas hypermegale TaxID=158847 RepID=UPI0026ED2378|nr:GNAT family N-acetyltransferase [Megamonas hypermegale]